MPDELASCDWECLIWIYLCVHLNHLAKSNISFDYGNSGVPLQQFSPINQDVPDVFRRSMDNCGSIKAIQDSFPMRSLSYKVKL